MVFKNISSYFSSSVSFLISNYNSMVRFFIISLTFDSIISFIAFFCYLRTLYFILLTKSLFSPSLLYKMFFNLFSLAPDPNTFIKSIFLGSIFLPSSLSCYSFYSNNIPPSLMNPIFSLIASS